MYHQYQLSAKLAETLEKIDRTFSRGRQNNQTRSRTLRGCGIYPQVQGSDHSRDQRAPSSREPQRVSHTQSIDDVRRISEITANIYRESTPQAVLHIAVNEIGRAIECQPMLGGLGSP